MSSFLDIEAVPDSMRNPAWRWNIAMYFMADPQASPLRMYGDRYLVEAIKFYRFKADLLAKPYLYKSRYPEIYEAFLIFCSNSEYGGYRWTLEAMLMTDAVDDDIAEQFCLVCGGATVDMYRKVFFDIEPYRHKPACVVSNVLATSLNNQRGTEDADYTWKIFAHEWGLDGFMDFISFRSGKRLPRNMRDWFHEIITDRMAYAGYQVTPNLRRMYNEQAVAIIGTATENWKIDSEKVENLVEGDTFLAAKQLLGGLQDIMLDPNLERKIEKNVDPVEPRMQYEVSLLEN